MGEQGFSLPELIVAIMILAVGIVGLAGTTGWVVRQVTLADLAGERTAAMQSAIEQLRAMPYQSIQGTFTLAQDPFIVYSTVVTKAGKNYTDVRVVTIGPGIPPGGANLGVVSDQVRDSIDYRILGPGF